MINDISVQVRKSEVREILAATFPEYKGRTIRIDFADQMIFLGTNNDGGTCSDYKFMNTTQDVRDLVVPAPWMNPYEGAVIDLSPDVLVVEHKRFCGTDLGIRIHAHSSLAPKWLPAPKEA